MESIEKLRSCGVRNHQIGMRFVDENELQRIADKIEAEWQDSYDAMCLEIERDYMKLPVDADGVPIHMGDTVEGSCLRDDSVVKGIVNAYHIYADDNPDTVYIRVGLGGAWTIKELRISCCHHVKSRTLEDVLWEFIAAYDEWDDNAVDDRMERRDELFAKYADEIRELLGGDAE